MPVEGYLPIYNESDAPAAEQRRESLRIRHLNGIFISTLEMICRHILQSRDRKVFCIAKDHWNSNEGDFVGFLTHLRSAYLPNHSQYWVLEYWIRVIQGDLDWHVVNPVVFAEANLVERPQPAAGITSAGLAEALGGLQIAPPVDPRRAAAERDAHVLIPIFNSLGTTAREIGVRRMSKMMEYLKDTLGCEVIAEVHTEILQDCIREFLVNDGFIR